VRQAIIDKLLTSPLMDEQSKGSPRWGFLLNFLLVSLFLMMDLTDKTRLSTW